MSDRLAQELANHVSRMYRVALRIVGCTEAAQDVAQDACVKAIRGVGQFDGQSGLASWLHRITVNCAYDHLLHRNCRADWDSKKTSETFCSRERLT